MIYREHAEHSKEIDFMLKVEYLICCFRSPGDSVEDKRKTKREITEALSSKESNGTR